MDISEDLIKQAIDGDIVSFEQIYKTLSGFVYSLAMRVLKSEQNAQELTQDVFVKLHKELKNFRFESSLKTWVYRMTINMAINYQKKVKTRISRETTLDDQTITQHSSNDNHGDMLANEERISQLLEQIPEEYRVCIILRSIEGLSYQEIADTLKININTVRTRLKRAREKLLSLKEVGL